MSAERIYSYKPTLPPRFTCTDAAGHAIDVRDVLTPEQREVRCVLWEYSHELGRMVIVDEGVRKV